nr:hypothetical protein [Clostridia bacterium]
KDRLNFDDNQFKLLRIHLNKFVTGRYKDIWCGYSNIEVGENITCFSFQSLFSQKNSVVANAQMLLIFRYIEQEVINLRNINKGKEEKQNSLVICDEAHMYIDSKFPVALDFFYQMNKRIRKYFGSIFLGSQNISDFIQTEELRNKTSSIIKNSQYVFIFKMSDLDIQDMNKIFGSNNGFTDVEKENMRRLKLGECLISSAHNKTSVVQIKADNCISKVFLEK